MQEKKQCCVFDMSRAEAWGTTSEMVSSPIKMVFQASQVENWETKGADTSFYFSKLIIRCAELKKPGCNYFFIKHVSKLEVSLVVFWGWVVTLWVFKPQFSRTCLHDLSEETTSCYHMIVMSWHLNIYLFYTVVQNADGRQEAFFYLRTLIVQMFCVVYGCSSWSTLKQKQELFIV